MDGSRNGESLSKGSMKGTWREGSFTGTPEGTLSKALEMGICFIGPHFWGTRRDALFLGPLREEKISYLEKFL